jgi:mRNA interferase RelE/StbE
VAYEVVIQESASKALRKLDEQVRRRVAAAVDALADDPRPPGIKAVAGEHGSYRIRVGDWRVLYEVDDERRQVLVAKIAHRSTVYDRR